MRTEDHPFKEASLTPGALQVGEELFLWASGWVYDRSGSVPPSHHENVTQGNEVTAVGSALLQPGLWLSVT